MPAALREDAYVTSLGDLEYVLFEGLRMEASERVRGLFPSLWGSWALSLVVD